MRSALSRLLVPSMVAFRKRSIYSELFLVLRFHSEPPFDTRPEASLAGLAY